MHEINLLPIPPTPQSTPELGGSSGTWPAICDLQVQIHHLLRKLDQLEARMSEADSMRTIWLPGVFLTRDNDLKTEKGHEGVIGSADTYTAHIDTEEWDAIVSGIIEGCS